MPDLQKLHTNKERILTIIKNTGPSFPARIARETQIAPLFVSAFLAELVSEKRLALSNLKVGSSPLYYLKGQEEQLEKFIEYLNPKQREAFEMLKDSKVLEDSALEPAIRVAIRSIKDFAFPLDVRQGEEQKIYWRFLTVPQENVKDLIQNSSKKFENLQNKKQITQNDSADNSNKSRSEASDNSENSQEPSSDNSNHSTNKDQDNFKTPKTESSKEKDFSELVKDYLKSQDIEVMDEFTNKKREFSLKIRTDTPLGKQEYFLISKDKKKVSQKDLSQALEKAYEEKLPALFMSPGELDKKAKEYLREWKNLVKFEKLKI